MESLHQISTSQHTQKKEDTNYIIHTFVMLITCKTTGCVLSDVGDAVGVDQKSVRNPSRKRKKKHSHVFKQFLRHHCFRL